MSCSKDCRRAFGSWIHWGFYRLRVCSDTCQGSTEKRRSRAEREQLQHPSVSCLDLSSSKSNARHSFCSFVGLSKVQFYYLKPIFTFILCQCLCGAISIKPVMCTTAHIKTKVVCTAGASQSFTMCKHSSSDTTLSWRKPECIFHSFNYSQFKSRVTLGIVFHAVEEIQSLVWKVHIFVVKWLPLLAIDVH